MRRGLAVLFAAALVSTFGGGPEGQSLEEQLQEETPQEERIEGESKEELAQRQQASYYDEGFAGSPTASG